MNVKKLTIVHATSTHEFLVEQELAIVLEEILVANSTVEEVMIHDTTELDVTRFNIWEPTTKSEEWLRAAKEQMNCKLVPYNEKKDGKQPEEAALMMAMYKISSKKLMEAGSVATPKVIQHKVMH